MLNPGDSLSLQFSAPASRPGQCSVIELDARLQAPTFAGSNIALAIDVNGVPVSEDRLLDKPLLYAQANRVLSAWCDGGRWRVVYSPDFDPGRNTTGGEHRVVGVDPYHLVLRIDDLVRPGANTLRISDIGMKGLAMEVAHVRLGTRPCPPQAKSRAAQAPLAAVPFQLSTDVRASMEPGGAIRIDAGGAAFEVETEVSLPRGGRVRLGHTPAGWKSVHPTPGGLRAQAAEVAVDRRISMHDGVAEVRDTFRAESDLGLQVRYRLRAPVTRCATWLGGVRVPDVPLDLGRYEPQAPSAVAVTDEAAIGVVPANDTLWIQAASFRDSSGVGLADDVLCVGAQDSVTLAFQIVAAPHGTYSDWLDAARTLGGANFTLEGGFSFGSFAMTDWPPEKLHDWIAMRHLHYISTPAPTASGSTGLFGPALLQSPKALDMLQRFAAAVHRAAPDVKVLAYFHCYLLNSDAVDPRYQNDRALARDLSPMFYPRPSDPRAFQLFVPRAGSPFAADLEKLLGRFWEAGFDGIYWDEMSYSATPWTYGKPWDGVSGDIDPSTHALRSRKSAVPLLVQPWIEARLEELQRLGKSVVANTQPVTVSMRRYRFPRFVETASTISLASAVQWSPIGLGDRLREHDSKDIAARIRAHLEHGSLYYFYSAAVPLDAPNLTAYMFPLTPLRIRDGTILARERILTSRPGRYGWQDATVPEVHVFDAAGHEIPAHVQGSDAGGVHWTDLDLGPGETAALVRK